MKTRIKKTIAFVLSVLLLTLCMVFTTACGAPGEFYSLEEAYELNYINKGDLETIATYHNNNIKYPQELSSEIEEKIKITACERVETTYDYDWDADSVEINKYYGKYNDFYAVRVHDHFLTWLAQPWSEPRIEEIAGVKFEYWDPLTIELWRDVK